MDPVQIPGIFVDRKTYPFVNVGFLHTQKDDHHDDPKHWATKQYSKKAVIDLRRNLLNASFATHAVTNKSKMLDIAKEIALSSHTVDADIDAAVSKVFTQAQDVIPYGGYGNARSVQPHTIKTDQRIEKKAFDIECKATVALTELFAKGVHEHKLMQVLSTGNFGVEKNRKVVPTRWSITAVDDTLAKNIIPKLPLFTDIDCTSYFAEYLGNYFLILCFDGPYMFEFIEIMPDGQFMQDVEQYGARSAYAQNTAGGYYATRLPIVEFLQNKKRCGSIVAIRYISPSYKQSLGVWVVRETVRKALDGVSIGFSDKVLLEEYARKFFSKKLKIDLNPILNKSFVLDALNRQKTIFDF
ncbi:MAG: hypothetical protein ACI8Y7_000970 [Candidatus Woesearchaeota archaeon]|jgi:hypothetical protein